MRPSNQGSLDIVPANIRVVREIDRSDASSVFETELEGRKYAMKLFHDNGDLEFAENGRDLNQFRCELNAYMNLREHGVCERGFVPYFYGHIDRIDPTAFDPAFQLAHYKYHSKAILNLIFDNTSLGAIFLTKREVRE
ncbi:hypothetical protein N7516_011330 [Penicillium verrucosum]|uniref:uncharacterized protein n=1 Tax=Penicillium verrucosum TaxID=60171 RepID=UPI0025458D5D|nr:uncharacterized protein N7516_011330 [Penicillium verrucosum]KAJ5920472.1 hypothetical protein N7516_011330 [Penicillium verrucosum]